MWNMPACRFIYRRLARQGRWLTTFAKAMVVKMEDVQKDYEFINYEILNKN